MTTHFTEEGPGVQTDGEKGPSVTLSLSKRSQRKGSREGWGPLGPGGYDFLVSGLLGCPATNITSSRLLFCGTPREQEMGNQGFSPPGPLSLCLAHTMNLDLRPLSFSGFSSLRVHSAHEHHRL